MSKEINSHIQMPRMMLRRFENEHKLLCSYSVISGHIASKASAKTVNTQKGYFSENTEKYLSQSVERPFSEALKEIDTFDFETPNFQVSLELQQKILHYAYALMARSKIMENQVKSKFVIAAALNEQALHDVTVFNGIQAAILQDFWGEYYIGFVHNISPLPFVLPTSGIYGVLEEGRETNINVVMPISPSLAIMLREPHKEEIPYIFFRREADENTILAFNAMAFEYQCRRGVGFVVSPTREPLQMILDNRK